MNSSSRDVIDNVAPLDGEALRDRANGLHVIITGRDAPRELIDFADLVTKMREIKHPYQQGIRAQPGIDF